MTEYRNLAARVPRRGFSANTFPISERDAHLFGVFSASLWPRLKNVRAALTLSYPLPPFFDTCPSEKFPRIALSRRTSRWSCSVRVSAVKSTDYREINEDAGVAFASSYVSASREWTEWGMFSTISSSTDAATSCRLQNCLAIMSFREKKFPRDSLSPLPELFVYGMFWRKELTKVSTNHANSISGNRYLFELDLNQHLLIF